MAPIVAHVFCNVMGLPAIGDVFRSSHCKGFIAQFHCQHFFSPFLAISKTGSLYVIKRNI